MISKIVLPEREKNNISNMNYKISFIIIYINICSGVCKYWNSRVYHFVAAFAYNHSLSLQTFLTGLHMIAGNKN